VSLYMVKVAVKYEQILRVEAESREAAEEGALDSADRNMPRGAERFEGCPYVVETREPRS
jgi:hypothetical protein